jgi:hypothetical protein
MFLSIFYTTTLELCLNTVNDIWSHTTEDWLNTTVNVVAMYKLCSAFIPSAMIENGFELSILLRIMDQS